ncbi:lytic transglycosylase domain-containing protein [Candidatus Symbiobacter mobilis]|uniref:Soluble lytic murein transglycosylase n=1 Tax=Candidatus Symbiobacter mobilis CR TaxID=946483 RepID=U5N9L2_9BURK|nr:lytic transglycosylase domain-containing protein [Candidatus Symbiobacter mobilis]AGX88005.1 soluble lytic murein transglycosylase [Candidatus Symbiobacter mobilis CR]
MQWKALCAGIAVVGALCIPPAGAQPSADAVIVRMHEAFQKNDSTTLQALLPQARGHLLAPWAAYWALRVRLDTASDAEVATFLRSHAGTYHEDRLRNDWLLVLGQRRDWPRFTQMLAGYRMHDDPAVRCYTLARDLLTTAIPNAEEVRSLWFALKAPDDACALAAQSHLAAGHLTADDVWEKARIAAQGGHLRTAKQAVEMVAPAAMLLADEALERPERFLHSLPRRDVLSRELATLALLRLATQFPHRAAAELARRWGRYLYEPQRAWVWGAIGRQAMLDRSGGALDYFRYARPERQTDDHLAWRVRAALCQSHWSEVRRSIEAMRPDVAAQPVWVYWYARSLLQPGALPSQRKKAHAALQRIASTGGFYEMLALEELGQLIAPPPRPAPLTAEERRQARSNPGLQRALAAIAVGLRAIGIREWNYTTSLHTPGGMDDRSLLAAAELACQKQMWDRCIHTSERARKDIDISLRYPMPYREAIVRPSTMAGLDPAFVLGLIRQESRFLVDASSGVGATGLMQLMPRTARWMAADVGMAGFAPEQLTDTDVNLRLGTAYLRHLVDGFAGALPMATAAYNAGPARPRQWRCGPAAIDSAAWIESIPFGETRDYVKKVLANATMYAALLTGQPQSLRSRLTSSNAVGKLPEGLP